MVAGFDCAPFHAPSEVGAPRHGSGDELLSFPERVHAVVARIPWGSVTTYGAIARALGSPRSARMVGWALRYARPDQNLPCHRVVNRIGFLSGGEAFGHPDIMRDLLLAESVPFCDAYQVDLNRAFWDPADDSTLDPLFHFRS